MKDHPARRMAGFEGMRVVSWRVSSRSGTGSGQNCVEVGAWRTSSRSGDGGNGANCVEVGTCVEAAVAVRDSKHRTGGVLSIDAPEWLILLSAIKTGTLDG